MIGNNFVIDFFFHRYRTIFQIKIPILKFTNRWHCKLSHQVAHSLFTIPRNQLYSLSCHCLEVKGDVTDVSGNPV